MLKLPAIEGAQGMRQNHCRNSMRAPPWLKSITERGYRTVCARIVKCIRIEFLDRKLRHRDRVHLERVIDGKKHSTFARLIRSRDGKALVREGDDATPVDLTSVKGVVLGVDITYRL